MKSFQSIHLIVFTLCTAELPVLANNCLSVQEAEKKGLIKLSFKGKGGHTGNVIEMKIKNLTNHLLDLNIEAGRILDSRKQDEQDLLVTMPQTFAVNGNQEKSVSVFGMCCQAHNASPELNSEYGVGKMADSVLIKLARFINENKKHTSFAAQEAVWTISDNYSLASIYGSDEKEESLFKKFVSTLTGRPIPTYNITYLRENNRSVSGHASTVQGIFKYVVPHDGKVTIAIYDSNGKLVQTFVSNYFHEKGDCKLYYTFNTRELNSGTYYAKMMMDGAVQNEMPIEF